MTCENGSLGREPCGEKATHGFTWPGQKRSKLCQKHLDKLLETSIPHLLMIEPLATATATKVESVDLPYPPSLENEP